MEVMAPATINALNGSSVKLSCTFNSCYKVENKQFSLNWTYQECWNCSEELVSLSPGLGICSRGPRTSLKQLRASRAGCPSVAGQAGLSGEGTS